MLAPSMALHLGLVQLLQSKAAPLFLRLGELVDFCVGVYAIWLRSV